MPVVLATQEAEIRRIRVQSQHWLSTLSQKYPTQKKAGGVPQVDEHLLSNVSPESKLQNHQPPPPKKKPF
jgi:hypothetical protein